MEPFITQAISWWGPWAAVVLIGGAIIKSLKSDLDAERKAHQSTRDKRDADLLTMIPVASGTKEALLKTEETLAENNQQMKLTLELMREFNRR